MLRITKLEDCETYRVESLRPPRFPFSLWKQPEWRVVLMPNPWFDYVPAEFSSLDGAERFIVRCECTDRERAARARRSWIPFTS